MAPQKNIFFLQKKCFIRIKCDKFCGFTLFLLSLHSNEKGHGMAIKTSKGCTCSEKKLVNGIFLDIRSATMQ